MIRLPPKPTRTGPPCPHTTLFRSLPGAAQPQRHAGRSGRQDALPLARQRAGCERHLRSPARRRRGLCAYRLGEAMQPAIYGLAGESLTADERDFFKDADPAGYILFRRNCVGADQLRALTDSLRALHGRDDVPILIDQDGGRRSEAHTSELPSLMRNSYAV